MIQLFINNREVDIIQQRFTQTKQVNDIGDIANRKGNYTQTFQCPLTANNIIGFDQLGVTGNTSDMPYQRPTAKVFDDGVPVIPNGFAVISGFRNGAYQVVVFDGNVTLKETLGNRTLQDLDYSSLNHDLNIENFLDSYNNFEGYVYGLARYDYEGVRPDFFINACSASIFITTLWDMIFTQNGLSYSGAVFGKEKFRNKTISLSRGYEQNVQTTLLDVDSGQEVGGVLFNGTNTTEVININITETNSYRLSIESTINFLDAMELTFRVLRNGVTVGNYPQNITNPVNDTLELNLLNGDIISFEYFGDDLGAGFVEYDYDLSWDLDSTNKRIPVDFSTLVTDTKLTDFIKAITQIYGLIYQQRAPGSFEFVELEILLRDRENAEDWSNKYSDTSGVEYRSNQYGQINNIDFKYDNNYEVEDKNFTLGSFPINDANLSDSKDLFTNLFTATSEDLDNPENYPTVGDPLTLLQLFHFEGGIGAITPTEDELRFFQVNRVEASFSMRFDDDVNAIGYNGQIPVLIQPTWNDLISDNYTALQQTLIRYQKRSVLLNLSPIDFLNADFLKLKYIEVLGDYFYLNRISNYQSGRLNKIELIRTKASPVTLSVNPIFAVARWQDTLTDEDRAQALPSPFNFNLTASFSFPSQEITRYQWQRRRSGGVFQDIADTEVYNESLTFSGVFQYRVRVFRALGEVSEFSNVLQIDYTVA